MNPVATAPAPHRRPVTGGDVHLDTNDVSADPRAEGEEGRAGARASRGRGRPRGGRRRSEPASPTASREAPPETGSVPEGLRTGDNIAEVEDQEVPSADRSTGEAVAAAERAAPGGRSGRARRPKSPPSPVAVEVIVPRGFGRRVDAKLVRLVAERALERNGWELPATLDVVFVTDNDMREINATRRGLDEATDVLSFPALEVRPGQGIVQDFFVLPPEAPLHLGDVVISVERFESQADEAGHSRKRELAFLTVHGVLHILGFDHETDEERRTMRRREEEVLTELGIRRDGA